MKNENYSYTLRTQKSPSEVFELLLNVPKWWSGLFDETIKGKSRALNDEFTFHAGGGVHYSKQKLVDLVPNRKIVWEVTDSKLTFIKDHKEWNNSKLCFELEPRGNETQVRFTHEGLVPHVECYANCSSAWTEYLKNLEKKLKK